MQIPGWVLLPEVADVWGKGYARIYLAGSPANVMITILRRIDSAYSTDFTNPYRYHAHELVSVGVDVRAFYPCYLFPIPGNLPTQLGRFSTPPWMVPCTVRLGVQEPQQWVA